MMDGGNICVKKKQGGGGAVTLPRIPLCEGTLSERSPGRGFRTNPSLVGDLPATDIRSEKIRDSDQKKNFLFVERLYGAC